MSPFILPEDDIPGQETTTTANGSTSPSNITTTANLVIGSLSTASDNSYQSLISSLSSSGSPDRHLHDRLLDGASILPTNHYENAFVVLKGGDLGERDLERLVGLVREGMKKDGKVEVRVLDGGANEGLEEEMKKQGWERVEGKRDAGVRIFTAVAPAPSTTSVPLRLKNKRGGPNPNSAAAKLWSFNTTDSTSPAALIDESTLLKESDLSRPNPSAKPKEDCDVKKTRKACKNCTCGLRELLIEEDDDLPPSLTGGKGSTNGSGATGVGENGIAVKKVKTGAVTSSCGSCYLGDAFRCSGCPYRGLPAFEPGQKVEIPVGSDDL